MSNESDVQFMKKNSKTQNNISKCCKDVKDLFLTFVSDCKNVRNPNREYLIFNFLTFLNFSTNNNIKYIV